MIYFSKLVLTNFQSHSYSEFDFEKGFNAIIGVSNVGKTSVARALSCLLFNSWDKSWVKSGEKFCRIELTLSDGTKVVREKGNLINKYILSVPSMKDQTFEAFGVNIPEPIQRALKIYEIKVGNNDTINLNFSSQLSNLFMLSSTGAQNARIVGTLSGAHYLDYAIRELNRDSRAISQEKTAKEKEIKELEAQIGVLRPVMSFEAPIQSVGLNINELDKAQSRIAIVKDLFERKTVLSDRWQSETKKVAILAKIEVSDISALDKRASRCTKLRGVFNKLNHIDSLMNKEGSVKKVIDNIDISSIDQMGKKLNFVEKLSVIYKKFVKLKEEYVSLSDSLVSIEKEYADACSKYKEMLSSASVCPICFSKVDASTQLGI